jgi:ABC-type ATPase involved in cell division
MRELVPSEGSITIDGKEITKLRRKKVAELRRNMGIVFQDYRLLQKRTVYENVAFALEVIEIPTRKIRRSVPAALNLVGLSHKSKNYPNEISGGEQQRTAIARAIVNNPPLLLADEPTGSVDPKTANYIFDVFTELNKQGQTILIVTHDVALSKKVKRVIAIRDGKISSERILKESYAERLKEASIDWRAEETQEEYVIMDKAGRVQIPRELLNTLNLKDNKLKLEMQDDRIIISKPGA